jgi:hypothetical protein
MEIDFSFHKLHYLETASNIYVNECTLSANINLSLPLRFTDSDYPIGIFKLLLYELLKQEEKPVHLFVLFL